MNNKAISDDDYNTTKIKKYVHTIITEIEIKVFVITDEHSGKIYFYYVQSYHKNQLISHLFTSSN